MAALPALTVLPGEYAVCRLDPRADVPAEAAAGPFWAAVRTAEELSLVVPQAAAPSEGRCESGWRILKVSGPLDFGLTGVLAGIARPLAEAGISIFAISTFDTDYVLVKEGQLAGAIAALTAAGHRVSTAPNETRNRNLRTRPAMQ